MPTRVHLFNQCDLCRAPPSLQLFFAADGSLDVLITLVINKAMDLVFLGETLDGIDFVLQEPSRMAKDGSTGIV